LKRTVPKKTLLLVLGLLDCFDFTGCAMSSQARRKPAYRLYVAKTDEKSQARNDARAKTG
jgi:hypothetical protein